MDTKPHNKPIRIEKEQLCLNVTNILLEKHLTKTVGQFMPGLDVKRRLRTGQLFAKGDEKGAFISISDLLLMDTVDALIICRVLIGQASFNQLCRALSVTLVMTQRHPQHNREQVYLALVKGVRDAIRTHKFDKGLSDVVSLLHKVYFLPDMDVMNIALYFTNVSLPIWR